MVDVALQTVPVPTIQAFKLAIRRILKGGQVDPALLTKCCNDIVGTQSAVHPSEQEALDYIAKKAAEAAK